MHFLVGSINFTGQKRLHIHIAILKHFGFLETSLLSVNFGRNNYQTDDKLLKMYCVKMAYVLHRKLQYFSTLTAVIH